MRPTRWGSAVFAPTPAVGPQQRPISPRQSREQHSTPSPSRREKHSCSARSAPSSCDAFDDAPGSPTARCRAGVETPLGKSVTAPSMTPLSRRRSPASTVRSQEDVTDLKNGIIALTLTDNCKQSTSELRLVPFTNSAELGIVRGTSVVRAIAGANAWIAYGPRCRLPRTPPWRSIRASSRARLPRSDAHGNLHACGNAGSVDIWSAKMICTF